MTPFVFVSMTPLGLVDTLVGCLDWLGAGAIKDSVVGEEAIVKFLLQKLGRDVTHALRAIRASGPVGSSSSAPRERRNKGGDVDQEVHRMRRCLYRVLSSSLLGVESASGEPWGEPLTLAADSLHVDASAVGIAEQQFVLQSQPPPSWMHTESDQVVDWEAEAVLARYDSLMHCLGVAGARNPSKEQGALIRLLRAFREGHLGKFMLDDLG